MNLNLLVWAGMFLIGVAGCSTSRPSPSVANRGSQATPARSAQPTPPTQADPRSLLSLPGQDLLTLISNRIEQGTQLASTLHAVDTAMEITLYNIRNAGCTAFKRAVPLFEGDGFVTVARSHEQGDLLRTGEALDVAILGPGFFEVQLPDGSKAYTRNGAFRRGPQGQFHTGMGYPVWGMNTMPSVPGKLTIAADGTVTHSSHSGPKFFRLPLITFSNPAGLMLKEDGLFLETAASGMPEVYAPDFKGSGVGNLAQGHLEMSNVHLAEETTRLRILQSWREAIQMAITTVASAR